MTKVRKYDPNQARDDRGRWTSGGGSTSGRSVYGREAEDDLFYADDIPRMGPDRDIATRIPSTPENVAGARALLEDQGYIIPDNASDQRVLEDGVSAIRRDWNSSSSSDLAAAAQEAAYQSGLSPNRPYSEASGFYELPEHADGYIQAYVKAQYDYTQAVLARKGISEITVYRGMALSGDDVTAAADVVPGALSSFTLNQKVATDFATNVTDQLGGSMSGFVLRTKLPASMVWSIGGFGAGTTTEHEIIATSWPDDSMLGNVATGEILKAAISEARDYFGEWLAQRSPVTKYDPNQPRDNAGKWTSGTGGTVTQLRILHHGSNTPDAAGQAAYADMVGSTAASIGSVVNIPAEKLEVRGTSSYAPFRMSDGVSGFYSERTPGVLNVRNNIDRAKAAETMTHEFAHLLDVEHTGYRAELDSDTPSVETQNLFEALNGGDSYGRLGVNNPAEAYLKVDAEVFARGFAQYVAVKTGNPDITASITKQIGLGQWTPESFGPIAEAFDSYLAAKGVGV